MVHAVPVPSPPTTKGARQADAILEATVRCLGRDGYAGTSLQRIADEAGVPKRSVLYYYGSREALFEQVVRRIVDRLMDQVSTAVEGLEEPADVVSAGFERLWTGLTGDPALLAAYFGLFAESVTDPSLRAAIPSLSDAYRGLVERLVANARDQGRKLLVDEESLVVLIVAGVQGLLLEFLERGDSPGLQRATVRFQRWIASTTAPADA